MGAAAHLDQTLGPFALKAFLAGLLHVGATFLGPDASFPKPQINRVRIVGDTVWFEGTRGFDTVGTRYCLVRRTGNWCRVPLPASNTPSERGVPRSPSDSIRLGAGLTLLCRASESWPSSCDTFGVLAASDGRVHWLIPQATQATRDALQRAIELETDQPLSMSTFVTARAADERAIWFGLGGGFPEGDGAFGGLVRFDRERRTVETFTHEKLASATVSTLAIDGDALWIGTFHPGEHGPWGSTGVLRRDLRSGRWTRLDSATTDLPDDLIHALGAADGVLYVATSDGLAAFEPASRRWNVRYFRRTIIADSVVYTLAPTPPEDESRDEMAFVLMEELRVARRGEFIATMRQLGGGRRDPRVERDGHSRLSMLAHPALLPFLVEALRVREAAPLASAALAQIGDRRSVPALRAALSTARDNDGAYVAAALVRLGDASGLTWLHERLLSDGSPDARRYALSAIVALRDTASVDPLLAVLVSERNGDLRRSVGGALSQYRSPALWRRMVDTARHVAALRGVLVDVADSVALSDSSVATALGGWALALLDTTRGNRPRTAFRIAARVHPHDALPAIMRLFAADERWAYLAVPELIRLTGIDTAPPVRPRGGDGQQLAREFWTAWWRANAESYRVVPRDVGERAYRRWIERVIAQEKLERDRGTGRRG